MFVYHYNYYSYNCDAYVREFWTRDLAALN